MATPFTRHDIAAASAPPPGPPMNEPQLFIVRVWRHADLFRASVRAVGDEQARLFSKPTEVAGFLAASVGAAFPIAHDEGGPDDDHR